MSIYSEKLVHAQVVINCRYSVAKMCTLEDALAYISGMPSIDDIMSYNSLTTNEMEGGRGKYANKRKPWTVFECLKNAFIRNLLPEPGLSFFSVFSK